MDWEIEYLKEDGIISVKTSGPVNWEKNRQMSKEALALGRKSGVHKFLVDHRDMEHGLSILQVDDLPQMFVEIGVSYEDKVAIIFNPGLPRSNLFPFFEDVAFLKSLRFRVFNDPDEAFGWLKSGK